MTFTHYVSAIDANKALETEGITGEALAKEITDAQLFEKVFDALKKKTGLTEIELIANVQERLKNKNGEEMSVDAARDEIIARACEDLFAMSEEGRKIFNSLSEAEQKTLRDKIKDIIKNLVDWVNELLGTYESKSYEAKALRDFKEELLEISKLWDKMLVSSVDVNAALEAESVFGSLENGISEDGTAIVGEDVLQMSEKVTEFTKDEYQHNCKELVLMDSVAELDGTELDGDEPLRKKLSDLFASWGNVLSTKRFGNVEVKDSSIRSEMRHGTTRNKVTAYAAIPAVLENGVVIDIQKKNFGEVERIVVAAPINISDTPFFMGVMIQRDKLNQRLYLHDVIIKKEASYYQPEHLNTTGPLDNENLFLTEILEKAISVGYSILNSPENSNKQNVNNEDIQFSERDNARITADMSDAERYEILRDKKIVDIPSVADIPKKVLSNIEKDLTTYNISSWEDVNKYFGNEKRTLIQKIASEFGVFKDYRNTDISLDFQFSKNNFRESYGKQKKNYDSYAKMFSVFDDVINKAIGIEVHNRNDEGYKPDITLNNVYVMVSAFKDGDLIYPVKLEVKEFNDKQNSLYVAISLEAIKMTEVSKQGTTENSVAQNSRSATISIHDIFKNVNSRDKDFVKYIPIQFRKEDVQYSERDTGTSAYDLVGEHKTLEKRYKKLEADFENYKERVKLDRTLTRMKSVLIYKNAYHIFCKVVCIYFYFSLTCEISQSTSSLPVYAASQELCDIFP